MSHTGASRGAPDTVTLGRVAEESGQTLTELVVVLLILAFVIGGLAVLFQGALKSQTNQNGQVQAQQQARGGLSALSRELHCASSVVAASSSVVTVTLPSYCPSAASTTLGADLSIPVAGLSSATVTVFSTADFNNGYNTLSLAGSSAIVCSTRPTATTFGGCTGGTQGTYTSGSTLSGAVTWCVAGASLTRFVGSIPVAGSCPVSGGRTLVTSLVGATPFTYARLPPPTFGSAPNGGALDPGNYFYEVTAVVLLPDGSTVEIPGTVSAPLLISSGDTALTARVTWLAYTPVTGTLQGYNVYGRDNGSSSPRLTPVPEQPQGLRKLNTTLITTPLPFDDDGSIDTAAVSTAPPLATISVKLIVDTTPLDTLRRFELDDDIVLRNSGRF